MLSKMLSPRRLALVSLCLIISVAPELTRSEEPTDQAVHAAIDRSLPFIEERGQWWIEEKDCVSCHRVDMMVWSLTAARTHGFDVSDKLTEWTDWAVASSLAPNDDNVPTGRTNKEGVAHLLLAGHNLIPGPDTRRELTALLADGQQPDGLWKAGGQLPSQNRPAAETDAVSTMWLALALAREGSADARPAVDAAIQAVANGPAAVSTEWHVLRILLAVQEQQGDVRDQGIASLRAAQHADGGWGWLLADESDALGTGMALYALRYAGISRDDTAVVRSRDTLLRLQRDNGTWPVCGTKKKKKDRVEETATYWGTTWAVLGLLATLPDPAASPAGSGGDNGSVGASHQGRSHSHRITQPHVADSAKLRQICTGR